MQGLPSAEDPWIHQSRVPIPKSQKPSALDKFREKVVFPLKLLHRGYSVDDHLLIA